MSVTTVVQKHAVTLASAIAANRDRTFHAHWPETPSGKIYGETANEEGLARYQSQCGKRFDRLSDSGTWIGEEASPYGFSLGISYPQWGVEELIARATGAQTVWQSLTPLERASVLVECLERASSDFFEIGYATQHTTGQGFVMAFQASGPHAFDRALESTAMGLAAQTSFADNVMWTKPIGKSSVSIDKSYRIVPKGVNLVIGCSTFPIWNSTPGMFGGLVTGNPVIVKPHPGAVYPIAILVASMRKTLEELGLNPNVIQLGVDTSDAPISLDLVRHPSVRIIDYTGGPNFGLVVEREAKLNAKTVYTEKAGVNCVILDSTDDLDSALTNIAFSLSLFSGQMCTAPQNVFVAKEGMKVGDRMISAEEVANALSEKIDALVFNEKAGPTTLGAIQNPETANRIAEARALGLTVVRESAIVAQPGFAEARALSPLVLLTDKSQSDLYRKEWFGPIAFVVVTDSFEDSLAESVESILHHGALSALVYTVDPSRMQSAEDAIVSAGSPVAFNFNSYVWVNQSAAFSDFHGAGCNPAGNATFSDWSFVTNRYNVIGVRKQA